MTTDDVLARVMCDFETRMRGREIHRALHEELMADLAACAEPWVSDAAVLRATRLPQTRIGRRA